MRLAYRFILVVLLIITFSIMLTPAYAGNANVTDCTNFAGIGSISEAVTTANTGGGTITFNCSGTIIFATELTITANVIINANGNTVIFDGGGNTRFFTVTGGAGIHLTVDGFTLQNGDITSSGGGGAIYVLNNGTLTVINSTFTGNLATTGFGGAISNYGTATITDSTFINNTKTSFGGAIDNGGTMTVNNSSFTNNSAGNGGAISQSGTGMLTINNSIFTGNSATYEGGAIMNMGTVTITDSIFTNNSSVIGGAIFNFSTVSSQNSHYENNTCANFSISSGTFIDNGGNTRNTDITSAGCPGDVVTTPPPSAPVAPTAAVLGCALDSTGGIDIANAPDNTYCRILMKNGAVVSYSGAIPADLIGLGVILAVDVYRLEGGQSINTFPDYARICLAGEGRYFYMDGRNAPRYSVEMPTEQVDGLTCAWIPAPGIVILTH